MNCDGIYLNYHWKEQHLERTSALAKQLYRDVRDVYVGLDIFGRGTPTAGEFNCTNVTIIHIAINNNQYKQTEYRRDNAKVNVYSQALDLVRKYNFSVAIFAPGWTHENFGPQHFNVVDDIFWSLIFPYLYIHVPIYEDEIFRSTFCRGAGRNYHYDGQVKLDNRGNIDI